MSHVMRLTSHEGGRLMLHNSWGQTWDAQDFVPSRALLDYIGAWLGQLPPGFDAFVSVPSPEELPMNATDHPRPSTDLQTRLVAPYRTLRAHPFDGDGLEEPAPPWAADVAAAIVAIAPSGALGPTHVGEPCPELVGRYALAWCARGEPVSRASHVLALLKLWPGPAVEKVRALARYLAIVEATGCGRAKLRDDGEPCARRPFTAPVTYGSWEERDARTARRPR